MAVADKPTLGRNNPMGAVEVYRRGLSAGTWTPDDSRRILTMQDDPSVLLTMIGQANKDPDVASALARMRAIADAKLPPERPPLWKRPIATRTNADRTDSDPDSDPNDLTDSEIDEIGDLVDEFGETEDDE